MGDQQLTYLGISYGTLLGATYANLFPGQVRAMVLDSNIDPGLDELRLEEATPTQHVPAHGVDRGAAATLDQFLTLCGSTTTDRCAFSAGNPKATRDKFERADVRRLQEHPQGAWTYGKTVRHRGPEPLRRPPAVEPLATKLQDLWERRTPQRTPAPSGPRAISGIRTD